MVTRNVGSAWYRGDADQAPLFTFSNNFKSGFFYTNIVGFDYEVQFFHKYNKDENGDATYMNPIGKKSKADDRKVIRFDKSSFDNTSESAKAHYKGIVLTINSLNCYNDQNNSSDFPCTKSAEYVAHKKMTTLHPNIYEMELLFSIVELVIRERHTIAPILGTK